MKKDIFKTIDKTIKKVWTEDLSVDYNQSYIFMEDSLKNAFYFHLRTRLGSDFLNENNLRIFTEYKVDGKRIDLVIVEIDPEAGEENFLGDCVTRILASIEMKYKNAKTSELVFYKDIEKILVYIDTWGNDTKHYFAFVQERYFKSEEIINWIDDKHVAKAHGKVTELYAY